jgi:hypothetical protein
VSEKNWKDDEDFVRYVTVKDKDSNVVPFDLELGKRLAKESVIFLGIATGEDAEDQTENSRGTLGDRLGQIINKRQETSDGR